MRAPLARDSAGGGPPLYGRLRGVAAVNTRMQSTVDRALAPVRYLKRRLGEQSTWAAIGLGVPIAAALTAPWSFYMMAVTVIGVLVPTTKKTEAGSSS